MNELLYMQPKKVYLYFITFFIKYIVCKYRLFVQLQVLKSSWDSSVMQEHILCVLWTTLNMLAWTPHCSAVQGMKARERRGEEREREGSGEKRARERGEEREKREERRESDRERCSIVSLYRYLLSDLLSLLFSSSLSLLSLSLSLLYLSLLSSLSLLSQTEAGRICLEGCHCDDYYRIRELLYQQYAVV